MVQGDGTVLIPVEIYAESLDFGKGQEKGTAKASAAVRDAGEKGGKEFMERLGRFQRARQEASSGDRRFWAVKGRMWLVARPGLAICCDSDLQVRVSVKSSANPSTLHFHTQIPLLTPPIPLPNLGHLSALMQTNTYVLHLTPLI